jgi:hypothetical protein
MLHEDVFFVKLLMRHQKEEWMLGKKKKKQPRRVVDHTKTLKSDLLRVAQWAGISLGVVAVVATVVRSLT